MHLEHGLPALARGVRCTLLAAAVAWGAAGEAAGCSFDMATADDGFRRAGAVFVGTVVESTPDRDDPGLRAETRVSVEEVRKGIVGAEVTIRHVTMDSACGVQYSVGRRYMFFTDFVVDGRTSTNLVLVARGGSVAEREAVYRRFRDSLAEADRRARDHPSDADAAIARAALLESWGDLDRALPAYQEMGRAWPGEPRAWRGVGRVRFARGWHLDAIGPLSRAVALEPREPQGRFLLERARLLTGDIDVVIGSNFAGIRLEGIWLDGAVLPRRDFSRAYLLNVGLQGADLAESRFDDADFSNVRIFGARLNGASLLRARFENGRLMGLSLRGATSSGARFRDVDVEGADLTDAVANGASFEGSRLTFVRFTGADLRNASFVGAFIQVGDFDGAQLDGADLANAHLGGGVDFSRASFANVRLAGAIYRCDTRFPPGVDPLRARAIPQDRSCVPAGARIVLDDLDLRGMNFARIDLSGASFRRALLDGTAFIMADLSGADFSGATIWRDSPIGRPLRIFNPLAREVTPFAGTGPFWPPNLDGAIFRGATIEPATFVTPSDESPSADLSGALLEGAIMICTNLAAEPAGMRRDRQVAWMRNLEPRRRGIILGDGCDRVPELRDLR